MTELIWSCKHRLVDKDTNQPECWRNFLMKPCPHTTLKEMQGCKEFKEAMVLGVSA